MPRNLYARIVCIDKVHYPFQVKYLKIFENCPDFSWRSDEGNSFKIFWLSSIEPVAVPFKKRAGMFF